MSTLGIDHGWSQSIKIYIERLFTHLNTGERVKCGHKVIKVSGK